MWTGERSESGEKSTSQIPIVRDSRFESRARNAAARATRERSIREVILFPRHHRICGQEMRYSAGRVW